MSSSRHRPPLGYAALTPLYRAVRRATFGEPGPEAALVEAAALPDDARVLDLGCGPGPLALALQDALPRGRVVGLDPDAPALRRARRASPRLLLSRGLGRALPFADGSFDAVTSCLAFHHMDRAEKTRALAEARRVLQPGGALWIQDWGEARTLLDRALFLPVRLLDGFALTADNTHGNLPGMLADAGFREVREHATIATLFGPLTLLGARSP